MMGETSRQLGRYDLRQRIAKGGMGEIYLAKMHGTAGFEKTVIIKTILPHLAEEEEFITKFLDEGRIVVQLVHGNIVPVFDMGEEDGEYYIAMEYIAGRDLREVIKRMQVKGETMPVDLALYVASEASKGLDYAHRKTDEDGDSLGLIHRDISPSNLLISSEGEVKIIDFGIARAAGRLSKTVSGRIQGKFCYMSPEQASGKPLDARSDIFSLGTTLYEMLTGLRPFEGQSDLESLDFVRKCDIDPPSTLNPEIPEEVDAIIQKALAKKKEDRYPSADKLQVDILQYLYSTGTSPTGSQLANFLAELFPEGLERKELKRARGSGSGKSNQNMNLDQAMDALLGGDPLNEPSESFVEARTATLAASSEVSAPSGPTGPTEPEPAASAVQTEESSGTNLSQLSATMDSPGTGRKRWFVSSALLGLLVGASLMVWAFSQPTTGTVTITSEPTGAKIYVDDALITGARTPHTLELEEGKHTIRLERHGFKEQRLSVDIEAKQKREIGGEETELERLPGPRVFTVTTAVEGAEIWRDGRKIGSGAATVSLEEGKAASLRARKEGCANGQFYLLNYEHQGVTVELPISCDPAPAARPDVGEVERPEKAKPDEPSAARITIRSEPEGAKVTINGKTLGAAPKSVTYAPETRIELTVEKEGYETYSVTERASALRGDQTIKLEKKAEGCLTVTLGKPQIGEISIDGGPFIEAGRGNRFKLPAGKHSVRVKNDLAEKDDTSEVTVEPGDECEFLHVWPM